MENQATEGNYIEKISSIPSADTGFAGVAVKKELISGGNTINSYDASASTGYHDTIDLSNVQSFEDAKEKVDGADFRESQEELSYVSQCSPCFVEIFFESTCVLRNFY